MTDITQLTPGGIPGGYFAILDKRTRPHVDVTQLTAGGLVGGYYQITDKTASGGVGDLTMLVPGGRPGAYFQIGDKAAARTVLFVPSLYAPAHALFR